MNNQNTNQKGNPIKDYVTVAERIEKFFQRYPEGRINTSIIEHDAERGFICMRAECYRKPDDADPAATGHAYEVRGEGHVNKTSYIENCETGAVGRALALCGFEVKRGIASKEEMDKAARHAQTNLKAVEPQDPKRSALVESIKSLLSECRKANHPVLGIADGTKEKTILKHAMVGFLRSSGEKLGWDNHHTVQSADDLTTEQLEDYQRFLISELDLLKQKALPVADERTI